MAHSDPHILQQFAINGLSSLSNEDPILYHLLEQDYQQHMDTLNLLAASSIADPSVLLAKGTCITNVTAEGYPGARLHRGCQVVDEIERLAIQRAKQAFHARYANVQPHSGTTANHIVIFSLLRPGDTLLGMDIQAGGNFSHGAANSVTGVYFNAISYGLNAEGRIDYAQVQQLAQKYCPKLIICGASAYPRQIDFRRFRQIADEVNAYLLADISHISGLIVTGEHPSPINHAHITTTSTYKQLYGPRGGLILMGNDVESLSKDGEGMLIERMQKAVFPYTQGTPDFSAIAAKARALEMLLSPEFKCMAKRIIDNSRSMADEFRKRDYTMLTNGTDNHMLLLDLRNKGVTGYLAAQTLEQCNIIINKHQLPGDPCSSRLSSGIRLGTNTIAYRGLSAEHMPECVELLDEVLTYLVSKTKSISVLDDKIRQRILIEVKAICQRFPLTSY